MHCNVSPPINTSTRSTQTQRSHPLSYQSWSQTMHPEPGDRTPISYQSWSQTMHPEPGDRTPYPINRGPKRCTLNLAIAPPILSIVVPNDAP
ncbi:MAG: hypothetical protein F6K19_14985 [Cyanothece sp. SIO1E1]|nr:hypothetical protein [Cyanothece sp. SIO1E1]